MSVRNYWKDNTSRHTDLLKEYDIKGAFTMMNKEAAAAYAEMKKKNNNS